MRIALAQLNATSGDISGNTARIVDAVNEAVARGADLVVTPEMAVPGYCIGDLVEDADFLEANERAVQAVAAAARGVTVVAGFIDFDPGARNENGTIRKYNAAAVL
ncbi:MAG TPA: nitrilase-related carbon-nitrogen hydrolase, partial [Woeseiaceae bacterium]|nr:nitrilase-related carbon-nitrogen hydrolase [Woeseiaceae bacterium]